MAKRSLIVHTGWAAIAVVAFALGSLREKAAPSGAEDANSGKSARSDRHSANALSGGGNGERGAKGGMRDPVSGGSLSSGADGEPASTGTLSEELLADIAREAFRNGNPLVRRAAFGRLLENLTAENAVAMRALIKEHSVKGDEWRDFHYAWGAIDGKAAMMSAIGSKEYDLAYSMSGFASAYPSEARRFLETLPEDVKTDRARLQHSLISGMADRDTAMATSYVFELASQGEARAADYLGAVTSEVLRSEGLEFATQWSESLPDGPLKGAAMDQVAHLFTNRDPKAAAEWAEQFAGQEYASRVIEEVGDEWAERDPVAAVNWLETLPTGGGQNQGLRSAYGEWAERDPVAAGERLVNMPRSEQRDYAISGYTSVLARRDPNSAIDWANSIAQDSLRTRALTYAGQALFRRDAEAARLWVSTSGLPPEAQRAVLTPRRRR